jgi:hypothetical protein
MVLELKVGNSGHGGGGDRTSMYASSQGNCEDAVGNRNQGDRKHKFAFLYRPVFFNFVVWGETESAWYVGH